MATLPSFVPFLLPSVLWHLLGSNKTLTFSCFHVPLPHVAMRDQAIGHSAAAFRGLCHACPAPHTKHGPMHAPGQIMGAHERPQACVWRRNQGSKFSYRKHPCTEIY